MSAPIESQSPTPPNTATTTSPAGPAAPGNQTDDAKAEGDAGGERPLKAAKPPVGSGTTPLFAQLVALLVIAVGVLGVQEALARTGLVSTSWTSWLLTRADGRIATFAMLVLFVVLVLVGLILLLAVFRPRPSRVLTLSAETGVFLRASDMARIAADRVAGVDGVDDVDAAASRKRLDLHVTTVEPPSGNSAVEAAVRSRLEPVLEVLGNPPRLSVDITNRELT